jgi:hypothetical protein
MSRTVRICYLLVAGVITTACTRSASSEGSSPAAVAAGQEASGPSVATDEGPAKAPMASCPCPMDVPGATVLASDVEGGIALEFSTDLNHVAQLRARVQQMASMHNNHACPARTDARYGQGKGPGVGMGAGPHGHRQPMDPMIDAVASVEEISNGARLVFTPRDALALETLRQQVRRRAEHMADRSCPMMQQQQGGTPPA